MYTCVVVAEVDPQAGRSDQTSRPQNVAAHILEGSLCAPSLPEGCVMARKSE